MADHRSNEEERLMESCEHIMVSDDFGEGIVYEWCIGCDHEEFKYV